MSTCIRTGFQAYIREYDELVFGDAFESAGTLILRVEARRYQGANTATLFRPYLNFDVTAVDLWFDKDDKDRASTLIARFGGWKMLGGYDGVDAEEFRAGLRDEWARQALQAT